MNTRRPVPARPPSAACAWSLATTILIGAGRAHASAQMPSVDIELQSKSWIKNSSFAVDRLQSHNRDAGLDLIPVQKIRSDRPAIVVTAPRSRCRCWKIGRTEPDGWPRRPERQRSVCRSG